MRSFILVYDWKILKQILFPNISKLPTRSQRDWKPVKKSHTNRLRRNKNLKKMIKTIQILNTILLSQKWWPMIFLNGSIYSLLSTLYFFSKVLRFDMIQWLRHHLKHYYLLQLRKISTSPKNVTEKIYNFSIIRT